jgi:hypothetical protein
MWYDLFAMPISSFKPVRETFKLNSASASKVPLWTKKFKIVNYRNVSSKRSDRNALSPELLIRIKVNIQKL